jgi:hypothetical protein
VPSLDDLQQQQQSQNLDWILRGLDGNVKDTQTRIERIETFLRDYEDSRVGAFDEVGNPWMWQVLSKRSGAWPGLTQAQIHSYSVTDASSQSPGSPAIGVIPGNHIDTTGGATWIPTLNGTVIAPLPTPPALPPFLAIDPDASMAYFHLTVNPLDGSGATPAGAITALEIDADDGSGLPDDTNTDLYQICAFLTVTGPDSSGNYSVKSNEGGVSGSQVYQACGSTALLGLQ